MRLRFNWNAQKNIANVQKHGIAFVDAIRIFDGPTVECIDDRWEHAEERWLAVGLVGDLEVAVVYTDVESTDDIVRWIISARRATRDERETFYQSIGS